MKTWTFVKIVFIFWFVFMILNYAFVDDLHIERTWFDYLVMPIPSFFFAGILTLITCIIRSPFMWFYTYLGKKDRRI